MIFRIACCLTVILCGSIFRAGCRPDAESMFERILQSRASLLLLRGMAGALTTRTRAINPPLPRS